jgi:4-hydroxy-2-oxoheptanedioate aldolase
MAEIPRLNGIVKALEAGQVAFVGSGPEDGQGANPAPFDGVLFEMEHGLYDIKALNDGLRSLLDRRQIATSGTIAPAVTPIVRIPPNAGESNWIAKQVLDSGVYGIIWPHIDTVEEAYNAVAAMRYPRRPEDPIFEPFGRRGDAPGRAANYWGVTGQEYYDRADLWGLDPKGEVLCAMMIESPLGIKNLPKILEEVPGIGVIFTGEGDLSQELGVPRQYEHPEVLAGVQEILDICKAHNVPNGWFHTTLDNVDQKIADGYRLFIAGSSRSYAVLNKGRTAAGRT